MEKQTTAAKQDSISPQYKHTMGNINTNIMYLSQVYVRVVCWR